jgi:hypothetical protein
MQRRRGGDPRPHFACSAVAYCSTACQRQGWKQHKKACVAPIRE